jgi:hypothetical protein
VKQYKWRRLITIGVIASLLLGLVAAGLGFEALHKIDNSTATVPATTVIAPPSGDTVSGLVALVAHAIGPKVTAVDFLATGGTYHDAKIGTGALSPFGWASPWRTTSMPNGTYEISSVGYNAAGQSSSSASITVKVKNP